MAREIHDTLAQGLTAIILHLESALPHLETNPDRSRERIERALRMARENLEEARRSVQNLRAAPLAGKPLAEALAALGRAFTSETGIRVPVRVTGNRPVPLGVEAELLRIAQEALANVRRHAQATEAAMRLQITAGAVRLTLQDNGQAFDPARVPEGRHGIVGMSERAKLVGGRLSIHSRPGHGTRVTAMVPLPPEEDA